MTHVDAELFVRFPSGIWHFSDRWLRTACGLSFGRTPGSVLLAGLDLANTPDRLCGRCRNTATFCEWQTAAWRHRREATT